MMTRIFSSSGRSRVGRTSAVLIENAFWRWILVCFSKTTIEAMASGSNQSQEREEFVVLGYSRGERVKSVLFAPSCCVFISTKDGVKRLFS